MKWWGLLGCLAVWLFGVDGIGVGNLCLRIPKLLSFRGKGFVFGVVGQRVLGCRWLVIWWRLKSGMMHVTWREDVLIAYKLDGYYGSCSLTCSYIGSPNQYPVCVSSGTAVDPFSIPSPFTRPSPFTDLASQAYLLFPWNQTTTMSPSVHFWRSRY